MQRPAPARSADLRQYRLVVCSEAVQRASIRKHVTPHTLRHSRRVQTGSTKPLGLRRFHGSATLNATRLSRDVDTIATSVVQHLAGLLDAKVKITLEIDPDMPSGFPENVVRTVTENCRTLKFDSQGFEEA